MTTINDVEFNMNSLDILGRHRNVPNEEPGSDESYITDMGYTGLVLRISGFEDTLAKYDEVINEFMKRGVHTLNHRSGWQYSIYSVELNPILSGGIVDNYFPYELILLTSTPYRESTTLSCRAKEITANNQEWSAGDTPCENILDNWSFEEYSGGFTSWSFSGTGSATQSATHKVGTYSAALVCSSGTYAYLQQTIPHVQYRDKQLTVGKWVKCATVGKVRLRIYDGTNVYSSANSTTDWEFLTVTKTIDGAAATILCGSRLDVGYTAYLDGAVLIEGASIPDYLADIDTDGSVDAVPDIKIKGGAVGASFNRESGQGTEDTDATEYSEDFFVYVLQKTYTYTADANLAYILHTCGLDMKQSGTDLVYAKVTYQAASLNGGAETDVPSGEFTTAETTYQTKTVSPVIQCADNETLTVRFYNKTFQSPGKTCYIKNLVSTITSVRKNVCTDAQIYNTDDTTVKCSIANEIEPDMIVRINADGTGALEYDDDFTTDKCFDAFWDKSGITHDTGNDELDIADDGYIEYKIDAKYPVTGIPTLTAQINITAGTPTIQISSDGDTWYDIGTAIVDDVDTVYDLDSTSLNIKGLTEFYWRVDCVKSGAATVSIKSFKLDIVLVSIDIEHPKISATGVSTMRCDQDADSGLNCTIELFYRDRGWAV